VPSALTNTTAWTYVQFQGFVPLTAQALSIVFTTYNNTVNGATIQITGVQLEKGSIATPFEVRPYATELALCQRYYEQSYSIGTAPGTNTGAGMVQVYGVSDSGSNSVVTQRYSVPKRASVTPTFYLQSGTSGQWYYYRNGANGASATNVQFQNEFSFQVYINVGAIWTPVQVIGHWVANAEL